MISSMTTALTLLRQDSFKNRPAANAVDDMLKTINGNRQAQFARQTAAAEIARSDVQPEEVAKPGEISGNDKPDFEVAVQLPPGYGDGIAGLSRFLKAVNSAPNYEENFPAWRNAIRGTNSPKQGFEVNVILATSLAAETSSEWKKAISNAEDLTRRVVGAVIDANSASHTLSEIDLTKPGIDALAAFSANGSIRMINALNRETGLYGAQTSGLILHKSTSSYAMSLAENVTQSESGEFRLSAYQIKTDDGKLVAEMKDNGHFVTYNEDGSVRRERDRSDVCNELSASKFGRLASLVYSNDKDLQFY